MTHHVEPDEFHRPLVRALAGVSDTLEIRQRQLHVLECLDGVPVSSCQEKGMVGIRRIDGLDVKQPRG